MPAAAAGGAELGARSAELSCRVEDKQRYDQPIMAQVSEGEQYMQKSMQQKKTAAAAAKDSCGQAVPVRLCSGMRSEDERMQSS